MGKIRLTDAGVVLLHKGLLQAMANSEREAAEIMEAAEVLGIRDELTHALAYYAVHGAVPPVSTEGDDDGE